MPANIRTVLFLAFVFLSVACSDPIEELRKQLEGPRSSPELFEEILTTKPKSDCGYGKMSMPLDHNDPSAGSFTYTYQLINNRIGQPLILHIPGGPGQDGISAASQEKYRSNEYAFDSFNHLLIDPRGLGCNFYDKSALPDDLLATTQHARDLVSLLERLAPPKFAIYGISYGTVVSSQMSAYYQRNPDIRRPSAIVLEGVLGRALEGEEYDEAFQNQWNKKLRLIDGLEAAYSNDVLPFGLSNVEWGSVIKFLLSLGGENVHEILTVVAQPELYSSDQVLKVRTVIQSLISGESSPADPGKQRVYDQVGCREVFDLNEQVLMFRSGRFKLEPITKFLDVGTTLEQVPGTCAGIARDRTFDVADMQFVNVPTYYFEGVDDPNTPIHQAIYNYDQQKNNLDKSFFVAVERAGHNPFSIQLKDCHAKIWGDIFLGRNPFIDSVGADGHCVMLPFEMGAIGLVAGSVTGNNNEINEDDIEHIRGSRFE